MKVLLIRAWIHPLAPIREVFHAAGLEPRFLRVDIEPAVNAALARGGIDLVLLDPTIPGVSRQVVEARMREHRIAVPLLELGDLSDLAERITHAVARRRS